MSVVFKAKTQEGFTFKTLADLLQKCVKIVSFIIEEHGITLCTIDEKGYELIDCVLEKGNFSVYKFTKKIYLGINASYFLKALKSVKKKDSISLLIDSENEDKLLITIMPYSGTNYAQMTIPIISGVQNIDVDFPSGYDKHILVPGGDYQKACKEMSAISKTIRLETSGHGMFFRSGKDCILSRSEFLGDSETDSGVVNQNQVEEYEATFSTACLSKFMKIAKLTDNIQVYARPGLPLFFRLPVGGLGVIKICIKSNELITEEEDDEQLIDDSDAEEE
jgi:proliferating cell nuclear antigen PCNA